MQAAGLVVVGAGVRRDLAADAPPSTANKARQSGNGLGVMGTTCPLADVSRPTSLTLFTRQRNRQLPELRLGEQTAGLLSLAANPVRLGSGNDFCDAGVAMSSAGHRAYGVGGRRYMTFWTRPAGSAAAAVAH
jgi:hypothetical protein